MCSDSTQEPYRSDYPLGQYYIPPVSLFHSKTTSSSLLLLRQSEVIHSRQINNVRSLSKSKTSPEPSAFQDVRMK